MSDDYNEYNIDNDLLISLVGQRPLLWDKTSELYKNRVETQLAWNEIVTELNPDFEMKEAKRKVFAKLVIQRWTHIRDSYYRSQKKIFEQKKFGKPKTKPYVYCKQLNFLPKWNTPPNEVPIETASNATAENSSTNGESEDSDYEQGANEEPEVFVDCNNTVTKPGTSQSMKRPMKGDGNPGDSKMVKYMDMRLINTPKVMNRHLSFFHGILPTLDKFNDDQVLEFQMGVLQLLKDIKNTGQNSEAASFSGN